jgi:hypothetical protein
MKIKSLALASVAALSMVAPSFAGDLYRINNRDSLITARHADLTTFIGLNQRHMKAAVRDMYNRLNSQGLLFNLQPGAVVEVTYYFNDGTAQIEWDNGAHRGFIGKADLTSFLGATGQSNTNAWDNPNQSSHKVSHAMEAPAPKPTPAPEATQATPAPTPEIAAQASTPAPATETKPVVNRVPVYATTNPVKIDHPTDLTPRESALLTDKEAVMHYFDDFFKRTRPDFSVADSSLFMEVQIGAYNYLVAKIAMNTPSGATLQQGFVIDMKNEYCTVLNLEAYHEFMHTGNIALLGEKHLNPLEN